MPLLMERGNAKHVVLYLEEWQQQMVKDALGVDDCKTYVLEVPTVPHPIFRYGVSTHDKYKRMYFTEWQMREIKAEAGVECEFIELRNDFVKVMYMAPPNLKQG